LTHRNAPKIKQPPGKNPRSTGNQSPANELMLQDNRVHFFGQYIAVVVADTLDRARHAASLVKVKYEPDRAMTDFDVELKRAAPPKEPIQGKPPDTTRGDPAKELAGAEVKIDATYTTPVENHNPMEPHATVADWDGDNLTVYDATQYVSGVRETLAYALDVPRANVRVVSRFIGGAFGCKGMTWPHVTLAAVAARYVGRPVKVVLERSQMFTSVGYRPRTVQRMRLGASKDGKLTAVMHDGTCQTSVINEFVEPVIFISRMMYASPSSATTMRVVRLDTNSPTYMRAPGECTGSFALESAMDEMAYALKMDPVEFRLRNYADADPEDGRPWSSKSLKECYRVAAERFGWKGREPEPRSMRDADALVGWGMATATYPMNRRPASALARVFDDGSAVVEAGSQDLGTGAYTVMTQVAADVLGLPVEKVRCELGDTDLPPAGVSGGSSTTASVGSAVEAAARAVVAKLIALAVGDPKSPLHGLDAGKVAVGGGRLYARDDEARGETFADLLGRKGQEEVHAVADSEAGEEKKKFSMHSFGAVFAEVRVDPALGEIRVRRMVGAYAAGRILNAKTARSQFMGGMIFGMGMALLEHTFTEPQTGRIVTKELEDYLLPVNADAPRIEPIIVAEDDPHVNPIGVKGIGEIGNVGSAAAIANAVFHATGKRVRDLPITLDKLL
jgi:xanthine dehydrogenase YagR molybdenum-binding subunit